MVGGVDVFEIKRALEVGVPLVEHGYLDFLARCCPSRQNVFESFLALVIFVLAGSADDLPKNENYTAKKLKIFSTVSAFVCLENRKNEQEIETVFSLLNRFFRLFLLL